MKCDIVTDLLPLYIDELTSQSSNEEIESHLKSCEKCSSIYQEMTGAVNSDVPIVNSEEIEKLDYLKKVRKKNRKTLVISISTILLVVIIAMVVLAINLPVSSNDVTLNYHKENGRFEVNLKLENGQDLIFSSKSKFIYDENQNVIGNEQHYKPLRLFHNPLDDVGNEVMFGTELSSQTNYTNILVIEFKDKTMTFVNGVLIE